MADKKENLNNENQGSALDKFGDRIHLAVEKIENGDIKDLAIKLGIVFLIIAGAIFGYHSYKGSQEATKVAISQDLGESLNDLYNMKHDAAKPKLEALIAKGIADDLAAAKASLLLGNIYLNDRDFDNAIAQFKIVQSKASQKALILKSAAEHGLATALMQKKEYDQAISALKAYIAKYGKMTGDKKARFAKTEPQDLAPNVADAMWKLALCYKEIKNVDEAKSTSEEIIKVYGSSPFAINAKKLLAVL